MNHSIRVTDGPLAIECRALSKSYGRLTAVDGLELSVRRGEVYAFLGPNGAGKSSTINMLVGLSKPTSGAAHVLGEPIPPTRDVLSRTGVMFEDPAFYPWMSGRRNLEVLLGPVGRPRRDIESALDRVSLREAAARKVKTYSRGMRQRLALAAAICGTPELLILDEPASGLDPAGIRDFRSLLRGFADRGGTVFLSSHQLSEVERSCDRVVILHHGKAVAEGTLEELGGDEPWVEVSLAGLDERRVRAALKGMELRPGQDSLLVRAATGRIVTEALSKAELFPESVTMRRTTLEDRFLEVTEDGDAGS